jgi:hypothetical protein
MRLPPYANARAPLHSRFLAILGDRAGALKSVPEERFGS